MSDIKNSWKQTGSSLGGAFRNLGKSLIKTGKMGVEKAVDWAENDDAQPAQNSADNAEAPKAEE